MEIEKFHQLEKLGFAVVEVKKHHNFQGVEESINEAEKFMSDGHYQIDGLVFVYNQLAQHQKLGETAHHPRYKMAFKFRGDSKQTVIEDIEWGVSRNGILTPVALVRPVELSGAMISRVTLHNFGVVNSYKLKQGDEIEIIRSGEVIPKFLSVIKSSESKIKIPQQCPVCKSSVKIEEIRLYCTNPNCVGRARENILNFVQKIGIEDLSFKRLDQLIEYGALTSISDLYRLSVDDLFASFKKEGSAAKNDEKKLANKIYKSIQSSKNIGIIPFFISLGISGGAANKCEKIVKNGINTIEKIKELTVDKLLTIDSFAEKSATDFIQSLQEKIPLIDELVGLGFVIKDEGRTPDRLKIESALFAGKSFCITGALSVGRDLIEEQIKKNGGVVVSSVSKKTNYLLTNETESSSSKFKKAKELQIPIVSEEWLNEKLKKTN
ncbi:MAG: hypothetical protein A2451_05310 [Bdellovibrionales bacterium RIFOXYC2_FULL_39_8]|nr:MAG: hypothetical protein A2451_05310 [Bdellovibrionales bacterium RIFOXYC2_FULL_39_8]